MNSWYDLTIELVHTMNSWPGLPRIQMWSDEISGLATRKSTFLKNEVLLSTVAMLRKGHGHRQPWRKKGKY
jgi:hypothetical protein